MLVLRKGVRLRRTLLAKGILQSFAAAGMAICGLGVRTEPLILVLCLAISAIIVRSASRTFALRRKYGPQAEAETVLLNLTPELEDNGFTFARFNRLPADCRDYLVTYAPGGELAFVIGLAGSWPTRGSIEGPQRVATDLSSYGIPHVPVILAAFVEGIAEQDLYGVLAVSPQRLPSALEDVVREFEAARLAPIQPERSIHAPDGTIAPNHLTFEEIT